MAITKKQKEVYDYIKDYHQYFGHAPTQNEIKEHFGLKSLGSVQKYLQYLNKEGLLEHSWNQRRGLEVKAQANTQNEISDDDLSAIPLLGQVEAGNPKEAILNPHQTISVPRQFLKGGFNYFALKVKGQSMIDAGIFEDDIVVCRHTAEVRVGQIVVAIIDGEATLKTLAAYQKNKVVLHPHNPLFSPITIDEHSLNFKIIGLLVGLLRSYS